VAKKLIPFLTWLALAATIIGCGGSVNANDDCECDAGVCSLDSDAGKTDASPDAVVAPTGCESSPYHWGDEALYICPGVLPFKEMNKYAFVQVGSFQFVNYRTSWVNSITRICVKNVGPTTLDTVTQINFVSVLSYTQPTVLQPPWPADQKICVDIPITVGAVSTEELAVFIASFPSSLPVGGQFQFAIESPKDVTFGSIATSEPVVGEFPVKSEIVTITDDH